MPVVTWLAEVFGAIRDVWAFRAPDALLHGPTHAWPIALGVALMAGLATMIGHAVVFAINRVSGLRMVAGMAIGAVFTVALRLLTAATIALLSWAATGGRVEGDVVGICYLFALAPLVLSFLVFVPYFGLYLGRLLEMWALLCLVALLSPVLGIGRWPALALAGGTWVVTQLLSRLLARPLAVVSSRVWSLATGHETFLTAQDILTGTPFVPLERRERAA